MELAALPRGALHPDLTVHQLHQIVRDGQTKTGATIFAGGRAVSLFKGVEETLALLGCHADTAILHTALQPDLAISLVTACQPDNHLSLLGELDGIAGQVEQDLAKPQGIAAQTVRQISGQIEQQRQPLFPRPKRRQIRQPLEHLVELEIHLLQLLLARLHLGEVKDVVEDPEQVVRRSVYLAHIVVLLGGEVGLQHQMGHTDDGIHWRADLMAHVGQKFALGSGGIFGDLPSF